MMKYLKIIFSVLLLLSGFSLFCFRTPEVKSPTIEKLRQGFVNPPDSARPGVYWYFMDGNMSEEAMTKDLESMKKAGIGNVIFLEVNVGIPRGKVKFLSPQWQNMFAHVVHEAERLGIAITLGVGPGWTGSGGPWVSGKESMKHLVASAIEVSGYEKGPIILPKPDPRKPYFGEGGFTPELKKKWRKYYEDVAVLAFPTPEKNYKIADVDEKALYYRAPYTSVAGVKPFLKSNSSYQNPTKEAVIPEDEIMNIARFMKPDGKLVWKIPSGNWTIMRLGVRNNGAVTRPAPQPGLGFEADKFDTIAIAEHLKNFTGKLIHKTGIPDKDQQGGLKMLHMDSWEMGAQNWTQHFREEFEKRRGYDPLPFYPVYTGIVVESLEKSERFLWDLRQTAMELVIENHAQYLKRYGRKYNMGLSIEPYDMNPTADMELGALADVPMCEFWSNGYGFNSSFSCIQAASIGHVEGRPVVAAEAFTAHKDAWKQYPGSMKNQGDWAFAAGVNRFVYHTFQHQSLDSTLKPGMTMGPYGVHWDRNQTWWPMADGYHKYITRCQYLLQHGRSVADILYLTPEGAPQVFKAPTSAFTGEEELPDRKGYNFDGCSPSELKKAHVENHRIVFPSGSSYNLLVMPAVETMTPELLAKIVSLVKDGAIVIGNPPHKSPSLVNYPECDKQVAELAEPMWGNSAPPSSLTEISFGNGKIYWGGQLSQIQYPELYPDYDLAAGILHQMGIPEDFVSDGPVRYTHHQMKGADFYFVSNRTDAMVNADCTFRVAGGTPELWDPISGETRDLPDFEQQNEQTKIPLQFEPYQSYFIVFNREIKTRPGKSETTENFPELKELQVISGHWTVSFDPRWGGPSNMVFDKLQDWTSRPESGIKYYSGIATYWNSVVLPEKIQGDVYLDLGEVCDMARVFVNGKNLGVAWTTPFRLKITDAVVPGNNQLEIEVANLWPNRLIGDEQYPDDGIKNGKWPEWLLKGRPRTSGRITFTTAKFYDADSPLLKSGLMGPVRMLVK